MLNVFMRLQVSAATASAYFHSLVPEVQVEWMTVCILGLFTVLSLIGMQPCFLMQTTAFPFYTLARNPFPLLSAHEPGRELPRKQHGSDSHVY